MSIAVSLDIGAVRSGQTPKILEMPGTDRPCTIGVDENAFVLVKNGHLEISYSPKFDHYWFSRCPSREWFDEYYDSQWLNAKPSGAARIKAAVKDVVRPYYHPIKRMLLGPSFIDRHSDWDRQNYYSMICPYIPNKSARVLDVGCGDGFHSRPFVKDGYACYGIEPSPRTGAAARRAGVNVLTSTVVDTPEIAALFRLADLVFSNHSIEHHWDPRVFLALARDYMRENAILSITVPNAGSNFLMMQNMFPLHLDSYTERSLTTLLASYGFRTMQVAVSHQLRFVAIKQRIAAAPPAPSSFDKEAFKKTYQTKFLRQLGLTATPSQPQNFSISFQGSRPFYDLDYHIQSPPEDRPGTRYICGTIFPRSDSDPLVDYVSNDHCSSVYLK